MKVAAVDLKGQSWLFIRGEVLNLKVTNSNIASHLHEGFHENSGESRRIGASSTTISNYRHLND